LQGDPASVASHGAPGRSDRKVDYKDLLTSAQFEVFAKLRDLRKQMAEQEAVPVYAVFTNEQLGEMVRQGVRDVAGLRKIPGIGDAKVERYANAFLALIATTAAPAEP
jgi:superfamily II DNA helicase RecQ